MRGTIRQFNAVVSITKWPTKNFNPCFPHDRQFPDPKPIPFWIVGFVGESRVEPYLSQIPRMAFAYHFGEFLDIVIGVVITEGIFSGAIEVLSVNECDGPLDRGFNER